MIFLELIVIDSLILDLVTIFPNFTLFDSTVIVHCFCDVLYESLMAVMQNLQGTRYPVMRQKDLSTSSGFQRRLLSTYAPL